jgi:hypothetical protein
MISYVLIIAMGLWVGMKFKELFWVIMAEVLLMAMCLGMFMALLSITKGVC